MTMLHADPPALRFLCCNGNAAVPLLGRAVPCQLPQPACQLPGAFGWHCCWSHPCAGVCVAAGGRADEMLLCFVLKRASCVHTSCCLWCCIQLTGPLLVAMLRWARNPWQGPARRSGSRGPQATQHQRPAPAAHRATPTGTHGQASSASPVASLQRREEEEQATHEGAASTDAPTPEQLRELRLRRFERTGRNY